MAGKSRDASLFPAQKVSISRNSSEVRKAGRGVKISHFKNRWHRLDMVSERKLATVPGTINSWEGGRAGCGGPSLMFPLPVMIVFLTVQKVM